MIKEVKVPELLRTWFLIHFIVDTLFAIPLIFAPEWLIGLFNWPVIDVFLARLVGAALLGIGGVSFLKRNAGLESYQSLLTLKIVWSSSAILGILLSLPENYPRITWLFLGFFILFLIVWVYYKRKLNL